MYRIGIDLGGTNIVAAVVDEKCNIISKAKCPTALPRPAEDIVNDMAKMAKKAVEDAGITMDEVLHVGIGSPGTCNIENGIVEYANNLGFENVPVADMMKKRLNKPVYIENDANAAAYGEYLAGSGKDAKSLVCITLGTGVGGGVVFDGKIYSGFNCAGAELGHIVITKDGEPCTCGRKGCWEVYASSTALIRQTKQAMKTYSNTNLWAITNGDLDKVDGKTAFDGWRAGDAISTTVVYNYITNIACGLTNVINIFQPEILCIGGGICKEGDNILNPLKDYIANERYSHFSSKQTELVIASLGNDAGIIGAAFLDKSQSK